MTRLPLAQITLCAVETRTPVLALQSLLRSMEHVDFGRVLLFTNGWTPRCVVPGVELIDIDPIDSEAAYSHFLLRRLAYYIRSSHALVTRWDSFVVDAGAWSPEFLVHDYVAPVWPDQPEGRSVGSGGFSLRSRRYLRAGLDTRIEQEHPEDAVMGRTCRRFLEDVHGIRFAPPALAQRFAFDAETASAPTFGFHGSRNLPAVLDEAALSEVVERLPDDYFASHDALRLARALLLRGMPHCSLETLRRCMRAGRIGPDTRLLMAAARLARPFAQPVQRR